MMIRLFIKQKNTRVFMFMCSVGIRVQYIKQ